MRVLMLGWELPPHNSGGLGVACYQMCKHLAAFGVDIEFVLPYQAEHSVSFMKVHGAMPVPPKALFSAGGAYDSHCYNCPARDCLHAAPTNLRSQQMKFAAFVDNLVRANDYDAIHAHDWLTFEAGMRAKAASRKPLIAHVHATEYDRAGGMYGNPLVRDIEYNCFTMADRIVAVSQLTKDTIAREYGIPANKIDVVHNSVDVTECGEVDDHNSYAYIERMKAHGYTVVVSVNRLTIQKGLSFLLQSAALAIRMHPKLIFLIVGDGEQRHELIERAAALGIGQNIVFAGWQRGKSWRDAFAIGDIFVMSSVSEPFGLTALEAGFYNTAILLTKQSGVREILHNVITYDYWDTNKLADAIINIAERPALQHMLASGARSELTTMSWEKAAQTCRDLYGRLAKAAA